jgi:hypothetical protein
MIKPSRKFKLSILSIGLAVAVSAADASAKSIWACKADEYSKEDLWLVEWQHNNYVKLYGNRIWSSFQYEGEDRRWDFDRKSDGTARYSVVLKTDNTVDYYDFSDAKPGEELEPAYYYDCRFAQ